MLKVYTNKNYLTGKSVIERIDKTFNHDMLEMELDETDKRYLKLIDKAEYLGDGFVITPFGRNMIKNISTGCKTLILLNHNKDKVVFIGGCVRNSKIN